MKRLFSLVLVVVLCFLSLSFVACGCEHENTTFIEDTATCENDGVKKYKCVNCGEIIEKSSPKTGHDYSVFVSDSATCSTNGYKKYKCKNCDSTSKVVSYYTSHKGIGKCSKCSSYFNKIIFSKLSNRSYTESTSYSSIYEHISISYSIDSSNVISADVVLTFDAPLNQTGTFKYKIYIDGTWDYSCSWNTKVLSTTYNMYLKGKLNLTFIKSVTKNLSSLPVDSYGGDTSSSGLTLMKNESLKLFLEIVSDISSACANCTGLNMSNFGFVSYN